MKFNISLTQHKDGWWLYDSTRGMNLSMKAPTEKDALLEALGYYQKRLLSVEKDLNDLSEKVDAFVAAVQPPECEDD